MENAGNFYGHLKHFTSILYMLWQCRHFWSFGTFFLVLVSCIKKNLAILFHFPKKHFIESTRVYEYMYLEIVSLNAQRDYTLILTITFSERPAKHNLGSYDQ
jgi:hypothetical protein